MIEPTEDYKQKPERFQYQMSHLLSINSAYSYVDICL